MHPEQIPLQPFTNLNVLFPEVAYKYRSLTTCLLSGVQSNKLHNFGAIKVGTIIWRNTFLRPMIRAICLKNAIRT